MSDTGRDPYVGFLKEMIEQGKASTPAGMCLGTVLSISSDSLRIRTDAGLELDQEDVLLNPMLKWDAEETHECAVSGCKDLSLDVNNQVSCLIDFYHGTDHITVNQISLYGIPGQLKGSLTLKVKTRRLQTGDRVLLQPTADGQIYYAICKVVGI